MHFHFDRIKTARRSARILNLLLFILWGALFVAHFSWFSTDSFDMPAVQLWIAQVSHFLLLAGYLVSLKWERTGSALITVNSAVFFSLFAGRNAVPFIIVSVFPVMLYGYCWMKERHITRPV